MRSFDLAPLYRATVGFDGLADLVDRALASAGTDSNYPPYNIEKRADGSLPPVARIASGVIVPRNIS